MSAKHTTGILQVSEPEDQYDTWMVLCSAPHEVAHIASRFKDGWRSRSQEEANAHRIVACWNACQWISTEELVDIANTGGMLGPRDDIAQIAKQRDGLANALRDLLSDVDGLMGESTGVYGLHMNGDVSPWSELEEGGRFERLPSMSKARAAIARYSGEQS